MALTLAAAGLVAATSAAPANAAAASSLRMVVPTPTQEIQRWPGEDIHLYDLGIYDVADQAFEIRTTRAAYNQPVVGTLSVGEGASKVTTTLPDGLLTYTDHIPGFYALKVEDSSGKVIVSRSEGFCPNSFGAARATPTGASSNPYPYQCGNHPFARGYVYGIPRGWSVPTLDGWFGSDSSRPRMARTPWPWP